MTRKRKRDKGVISIALDVIESPFRFVDDVYKDSVRDLRRVVRGFEDKED